MRAFLKVLLLPRFVLERWVLGLGRHAVDDPATIIFSSGSTGDPKGVVLTHRNVASNVESMVQATGLTRYDRVLGVLPFFHSFGYTVTLWGPLFAGARSVYHPDPRAAKEVGELARTYGCTLMGATATFLRFYLRKCEPDDFKTMRLLVCGAEKLPPPLVEEVRAKFGIAPLEGYGCTEMSPVVSVNIPDKLVNGIRQVGTKVGSVGHPLPGVACRIVDPDSDHPTPFGSEGSVLVTGPNVMKGYLGRDDLTSKKIRDGWYVTGDIGRMDEDGFITLTGRAERIAKIAGEMIPLELIDEAAHKVLGVADRVLVVVPVPDTKRGERLVVLHLASISIAPKALLKKLAESGLPNLWIPDERDCFVVPEFPVLGSGKLDLQRLRDMAIKAVEARDKS